jgi:arabinose-5-phosphate isomerase
VSGQDAGASGSAPYDPLPIVLRSLDLARDALHAVDGAIRLNGLGEAIRGAVALIQGSRGRLIVTGIGKSGHIGRKIAATLSSTGTPSYFVHPSEAVHGDLGMIANEDVILALSWSGETLELAPVLAYAKRFGIPVVAITAQAGSALAQAASAALVLPPVVEACPLNLAPTTSTLLQLALGDALAIALLEGRGFSATDFKVFHPGGKLGAQLKHARDLMHRRPEVPVLAQGTPISEAILAMTACGFGIAGISDEEGGLAGIITDGDLRRHMNGRLLEQRVEEVMTPAPKVIGPDTLAAEALKIMNAAKISVLFVVENGAPTGLLRMHDILRAGAA